MQPLRLISHPLCPYVQRAVISLTEKNVEFARIDIDLSDKPGWFTKISPLGKTPVLQVGDTAIFESAVILEYLEETHLPPLHPADPLCRAEHRSWIEFASAGLNDIWGLYAAPDDAAFRARATALTDKFRHLEHRLGTGPYFSDERFTLVDAAFGPVFRYFNAFDRIADFGILADKPKVQRWRDALAARPSIRSAVAPDYDRRLWKFLQARNSHLSSLMPVTYAQAPPERRP
jgi:glutathione S-transferase